MSTEIHLQEARLVDAPILQKLGAQTFYDTYAPFNTEEDMEKYIAEKFSIDYLRTELSKSTSLNFIAWDGETVIGYLKINYGNAQTDLRLLDSLEIERLFVIPTYHGKQVGIMLLEKAISLAQTLHKKTIWLNVWEKNARAIRFYEKNGFQEYTKLLFKLGNNVQTDVLMKRTIIAL